MTGGNLRIDEAVLADLDRSMTLIRELLSNAGGWARNDAKAAGDEELADVLVDFADDWRKTRNKMLQDIDKFTGPVSDDRPIFAQTDQALSQALTASPSGKGDRG